MSIGIALVGTGAFGRFCLDAFSKMSEIKIVGLYDVNTAQAGALAQQYQAKLYPSLEALVNDPEIQIVALNTPPFLHAEQGAIILNAGKHLFCEKPLALNFADAQKLIDIASNRGVLLTVNYVMRHNPLWQAAAKFREAGIFGSLRHMDLANHAAGLALPDSHWFWDKSKSGGIWIEHGVHFFDAFALVAGTSGRITGSQAFKDRRGYTDRVECLAEYGDTAAHFYHGFDQSGVTEQTTVKITFENAYLNLEEWVPTRLNILTTTAPENVIAHFAGQSSFSHNSDGRYNICLQLADKSTVYQHCIQAGMRDLYEAISNPKTAMLVQTQYILDSLTMALSAEAKQ